MLQRSQKQSKKIIGYKPMKVAQLISGGIYATVVAVGLNLDDQIEVNGSDLISISATDNCELDFSPNDTLVESTRVEENVTSQEHYVEKAKPKIISLEEPVKYRFEESLDLTPLPENFLLASFQFMMESDSFSIDKNENDSDQYSHYTVFPKSVGPIMSNTNTRQLHLRFTHGLWDSQDWGQLPHAGLKAGGSGVELWAIIESHSKEEAFHSWIKLANSLSGMFCASINFIDSSKTTFPVSSFLPSDDETIPLFHEGNNLYLIRAALANEPICTENLTPFIKLLPTRGKSGISSLLDGHKIFDSPWHSLSIDVNTVCDDSDDSCHYVMEEYIETVINVPNTLSRADRPIPKPLSGDKLRCDPSKPHDAFQCFPLPESSEVSYDISKLFGKKIRGGSLLSQTNSKICAHVPSNWEVVVQVGDVYYATTSNCFDLKNNDSHDLHIDSDNSQNVLPIKETPVYVSRSLTGYGQDRGGLRSVFRNPSNETVELVYFEALPWFMRVYLSSLTLESENPEITLDSVVRSTFYLPAKDRERPTHLERTIVVPPNSTFALSFQFDKSLLGYAEYPPDANHGFEIESAVVTVYEPVRYESRTSTLLLYLSTPDFSMPYNVIILTSTIMGLAFGTLFNLLVKKLIPVEEADKLVAMNSPRAKLLRIKTKIIGLFQAAKKDSGKPIKRD